MSAAVLLPGFEGTTLPAWVDQRLREGLGGVCLFGMNIASRSQLAELTAAIYAANPTAIIAVDEEGGDVTRLYQDRGAPFPGNALLGRLDDVALTERVGAQVGWELRAVGMNLALAPDADINSNPNNPVIGVRSFGTDPHAVARHVAAWTRGVQSTGVAACAKHFPGHGDTATDSHHELPVIHTDAQTLHVRELAPFRAAIDAGARTVMTSHIVVPAYETDEPATFSRRLLTDMLRNELGFTGVIVTDALDMAGASARKGIPGAAVAALAAGAELLCIGTKNTDEQLDAILVAIDAAVSDGTLPSESVEAAAAHVRALGAHLARQREELTAPPELTLGTVAGLTSERLQRAWHVSDNALALLVRHAGGPLAWVALDAQPNMAVGPTPWGPFAAGVPTTDPASVPPGALAVAVGKDLHRNLSAQATVAQLRAGGDVLVVDMGWPEPSFAGLDIATFGASRLVGAALVDLIGRDSCGSE
jgi:beta-N-acetylhexosaminidase